MKKSAIGGKGSAKSGFGKKITGSSASIGKSAGKGSFGKMVAGPACAK